MKNLINIQIFTFIIQLSHKKIRAISMPVDFSLLSSKNLQINGISTEIDKRTSGYKRRLEALQTAPEQIPTMIKRDLLEPFPPTLVF